MRGFLIVAASAAVIVASNPAYAGPNLITNGSFEVATNFVDNNSPQDTMTLLPGDSTSMPGWTVVGGNTAQLAWIGPANPFGLKASDGDYFLDLTGYKAGAPVQWRDANDRDNGG